MKILNFLKRETSAKTSYSQCGEDLIVSFLFEALKGKNYRGSYLDIGAHEPFYLNNTAIFYNKGWRGINIEPIKSNIKLFKHHRSKDININCGLGLESGSKIFYHLAPATLSTFNKDKAAAALKMGHKIQTEESVDFLSVIDLAKKYNLGSFDLLSIDTEGDDALLIEEFINLGLKPKVIIAETIEYVSRLNQSEKDDSLLKLLKKSGYFIYGDTYINSIFVLDSFWNNGK